MEYSKIFTKIPISASCTSLPGENVETDVLFPVPYDTVLTVSCKEGYTLLTNNVITCKGGTNYDIDTVCVEGKPAF